MFKQVLLCLTLGFFSSGLHAAEGNKLLAQLQSSSDEQQLYAYNYITGIVEYESMLVMKEVMTPPIIASRKFSMRLYCVPDGVSGKQVFDIVKQHLEKNPDKRHHGGLAAVRMSLLAVWPCANNP